MNRSAMLVWPTALVLSMLGCNNHDVPLGGECERIEDCDRGAFACLKDEGAAKGYCTMGCSIAPPGTTIQPGGKTCEDVGMVCEKATKEHPQLGPAYCVKKR